MTYLLAFHPNNIISRPGKQGVSLADFRAANPHVPLVDGQWFQLDEDRLIIMDDLGQGNENDLDKQEAFINMEEYQALISSIKNPATPDSDKIYSIDIHPDAYLELDGVQRSDAAGEGVPTGFKVNSKGIQCWEYRDKTIEELTAHSNNATKIKITELESQITPRRLRDAILGTEDPVNWLADQEALIAVERAKLS